MKPRSLLLLLCIVGIPLGLLVWAAVRIAGNERVVVRQQFVTLMEDRLRDVNRGIQRYFEETEAHLQQLTELDDPDVMTLRHLTRTEPRVLQMFVLNPNGDLQYPDPAQPLNSDERSFLLRAARIFTDQHFSSGQRVADGSSESGQRMAQSANAAATTTQSSEQQAFELPGETSSGWFVWYWERGLNLIYWNKRPDGRIVGTALDRSRWMADVIAELPDTTTADSRSKATGFNAQMQLLDAASDVVYQWGNGSDEPMEVAAEIQAAGPLASWRLQSRVLPDQLPGSGQGIFYGLAGGLLAACAAVGLLAFVLIRDYSRDMREASRQVSFVNQVSHELKTPLTNIRMYAELLEDDLNRITGEESRQPRKRVNVILSEAQRLSRLIGNVLTFARQNRNSLEPSRTAHVPDDIIRQLLTRFEPSLNALDIRLETQLNASMDCWLDADFLEQILGNLISNVEKYAAEGGLLEICSRMEGRRLIVDVIDGGPGISKRDRDRVFEPFERLSSDINSAAGTGIGLSIARRLARLHGGDVRLVDAEVGCRFEVTLLVDG